MASLFDIVGEFKQLYAIMTEEGVDEQTISDTLESLVGDLERKSRGYIAVINQMEMEADACKRQAEFFKHKQTIRENNIKRMKQALCQAMIETENEEVQAGEYTLKVVKNGGLAPLKITGEVPQNMTKIVIEPDYTKIREFLKNNTCSWAHLEERGKHLSIK